MKQLPINVKTLKPWLLLLILTDLFFTFILWIISPDSFSAIMVIILLFTLFIIALGCYLDWRQQQKKIERLRSFLDDPNDITERNLLSAMDESWYRSICEASAKLREQSELLRDKTLELQNYQEFIEAWTHEIKTPLTLAMMLLDNRRDEMSPYIYKRMNYVRHSIGSDVDRILYYARLQAAHVDYQFERINLQDFVRAGLEDFKVLYDESNTDLRLNLLPIEIVSDKKVLLFILSQLFSNAFKYTDQSEGVVGAETWIEKETGDICLTIFNNGKAVPPEDIPFIFDKGFTGGHTCRQNATGMGLYFAKKYAQALSIKIEVDEGAVHQRGFGICLKFPKIRNQEPSRGC